MGSNAVPVLELKRISKSFPGVQALLCVDFRLLAGEVHTLMGQNGAGKSTLVKIMTGVHPPDGGQILLDGREIRPSSPQSAQRAGISAVFQEVNLCTNLSVAENIFLGREGSSPFAIRWAEMRRKADALLSDLNVHIDVAAPLSTFSLAVQQIVAIARALSAKAKVLILDEPTSSLAEDEVKVLFSVIRRLKAQGMAILFITHFLDQVFEISDRITVLRNGQRVGEYPAAELSRMQLVTRMVGRDVADEGPRRADRAQAARPEGGDAPFLRTRGLGKKGSVRDIDLDVRSGEELGIAGLLGAGKSETVRLLFGIDRADQGTIEIDGEQARIGSPLDAIARGLGFCPEDRKLEGIVGDLSLRENIILALQAKRGIFRNLSRARQDEIAGAYIERLGIVAADAEVPISKLSGGNQQKALLARWLATDPRMLILDEPTRGIDVAAKAEIMGKVMDLCDRGMAVVFVSSEMAEALRYADRVVVLRDRRKVADLAAAATDEQAVYQIIAGGAA
ncbi:sugar ABC transporter ATP-binding protein [Sorangium cellulosum]|uniref:Sugar ABC transporter ATP-binding protein n=1 Tax=Sorangium cellulosum TaxID=56 RepID=A0A150QRU5_SORCE|nr:sugar ABC transporter ATP-binding protein [Sorangium cellulosum]KYF70318.1 sugar ABC transporter ATP-binding protein [Sorangium cellulosum]